MGGDIDDALREYDVGGIRRTKALLRQSRAVSGDLVPRKRAIQSPTTLLSEQPTVTAPQALRLFEQDEDGPVAEIDPKKLEKLKAMMDKKGGALRDLLQRVLC